MSVVIFGSINMDLVVRCPRLPLPGETLLGHAFLISPGGKGANQAVACARLAAPGEKTYMVGKVGDDSFGASLRQSLEVEGIDTSGVLTDSTQPSGVALITVEKSGENTIVVAPGANGRVGREDVERMAPLLAATKALLLQLEVPLEAVTAAAEAAHKQRVTVILDPAPAAHLPPELYTSVDILTPNESEAAHLVGFALSSTDDVEKAAAIIFERGVQNVVIKLGAKGAFLLNRNGSEFRPAIPVEVVDSVAAGDAFNAGLATALSEGCNIHDAMTRAIAAGALAVTKAGAQPAMPHREAVLDRVKSM